MFHEENRTKVHTSQSLQSTKYSSKSYNKYLAKPTDAAKPTQQMGAGVSSQCFIPSVGSLPCATFFVPAPNPSPSPTKEQKKAPNQPKASTNRMQHIEECVEQLSRGYTRFPNSILMPMINGDLNKTEMKILLLIARLTISFTDSATGKECQFASLSKSTLAAYSGANSKTILEALESLQTKGLIRKVQGNHAEKNQFGLVYQDGLFDRPGNQPKPDTPAVASQPPVTAPQPKAFQPAPLPTPSSASTPSSAPRITPAPAPISNRGGVENVPRSTDVTPGLGGKSTQELGRNSTQGSGGKSDHYKQYDLNNTINNPSLKQLDNGIVQDYFRDLKPERKREQEREDFESIRKGFSIEQIALALGHLRQFGVPGTGARCHSPMAYLSLAITRVLQEAEDYQRKQRETHEQRNQAMAARDQAEVEAEEADRQFQAEIAEFYRAFPAKDAQDAYIAKFARTIPMSDPKSAFIRNLAIGRWTYEQRNSNALSQGCCMNTGKPMRNQDGRDHG